MRVERVVLKDEAHAAPLGRELGHVVVPEEDLSFGRRLQAADEVERGALAAAGGAEQADELAVGDLKGHVVDGDDLALVLFVAAGESFREVFQYDFHSISTCFVFSCARESAFSVFSLTIERGNVNLPPR